MATVFSNLGKESFLHMAYYDSKIFETKTFLGKISNDLFWRWKVEEKVAWALPRKIRPLYKTFEEQVVSLEEALEWYKSLWIPGKPPVIPPEEFLTFLVDLGEKTSEFLRFVWKEKKTRLSYIVLGCALVTWGTPSGLNVVIQSMDEDHLGNYLPSLVLNPYPDPPRAPPLHNLKHLVWIFDSKFSKIFILNILSKYSWTLKDLDKLLYLQGEFPEENTYFMGELIRNTTDYDLMYKFLDSVGLEESKIIVVRYLNTRATSQQDLDFILPFEAYKKYLSPRSFRPTKRWNSKVRKYLAENYESYLVI